MVILKKWNNGILIAFVLIHMTESDKKTTFLTSLTPYLNGAFIIGDAFGTAYYTRVYDRLIEHHKMWNGFTPLLDETASMETIDSPQVWLSHAEESFSKIWSTLNSSINHQVDIRPELCNVRHSFLAEAE